MHYGRENPAKEESSDKNGATKTEPVKSGSRRGSNCSKRRRSRNDRNGRGHYTRERPGMSAFVLDEGIVHHTYSTYARGLDALWACTSGSTAHSKDVMRPAPGGGVMTNTKSTGVSNEGHRKTIL